MSAEGMQTQVIAGMIVDAIVQDEKPGAGGFDLSAGIFGAALGEVIRTLARGQLDAQRQLAEVTAERDLARRELSIADTHRKELSRTLDVANATIDRLRGAARC